MDTANSPMDLNKIPAGAPPPGVTPDFSDNAPSQRPGIIGVCSTLIVLTTLFVALRCYITARLVKKGVAECILSVVAAALAFLYIAFLMHLSYVARHMWDVPAAWLFGDEEYWKLRLAGNVSSYFAFFFSRMPIFALYLRIFGHVRGMRIACWIGIALSFFVYLHALPVTLVFCVPRNGDSWISTTTFLRCSQAKVDAIVFGVGNIVMDLYTIILPIPLVARLHLSGKKKLGVLAVFLTGTIALIASCVSLNYRLRLDTDPDTDWNEGAYDITSAVEVNLVIICSCMPALAAFSRERKGQSFWGSMLAKFGLSSGRSGHSRHADWTSPVAGHIPGQTRDQSENHAYVELTDANAAKSFKSSV